jgi:hypothetical protein
VVALPCRIKDLDRKGKVESGIGHTQKTPLKGMLTLAKTLADCRIKSLQQDFQSLIWYNSVPCSACFFSGLEPCVRVMRQPEEGVLRS